ncbi:MAG: CBS domain-containing protein [Myxococcales bacterium]|nr:CBS domain-containing protein [Myxococcales bacterium]
MSNQTSLDFELDRVGREDQAHDVARIFVSQAQSFTRHTGAPVLTADCTSLVTFEREVERLKAELDAALEAARTHFEGSAPAQASAEPTPEPEPEPDPERTYVDLGLRVEDVMTRTVKTVGRNDHLTLVDELMKVGHFRHVVVLDEDEKLAGVVSHRDIFLGALAWSMGQASRAHDRLLASTPAKEVMQSDPVTVDPATLLTEAATLMAKHKIGCLPVVRGEDLVGILTEGDFLALLSRRSEYSPRDDA